MRRLPLDNLGDDAVLGVVPGHGAAEGRWALGRWSILDIEGGTRYLTVIIKYRSAALELRQNRTGR